MPIEKQVSNFEEVDLQKMLKDYRPEIDGLRAISVLGVLIYHLNPDSLPGGFLGVDVFLVISGYLISRNILYEIKSETFSFKEFWLRRFKRLYPNLLLMVCFTVVVGNFILINPERHELVLQAVASLFAFSNIFFWKTTGGYWDVSSENIALLHTWSLSLEEQFYLIFPIFLVILSRKIKPSRHIWIIIILALSSFILCIMGTGFRRSAAFYLLPTRMWEFFVGVILAFYSQGRIFTFSKCYDGLIVLSGLLLIGLSFLFIENNEKFPGYLPIFACVGAGLVITYSKEKSIFNNCLRHPVVVYIGKASYSIYLWHWPVIVFSKFLTISTSVFWNILITLALAIPAYHIVEIQFRYKTMLANRFCTLFLNIVIAGLIGILAQPSNPLLPKKLAKIDDPGNLTRGLEFEATESLILKNEGILVGNNINKLDFAVLGSSHARVLGAGFADFANQNNISGLMLATTMVGITTRSSNEIPMADIINERRLKIIENSRPRIIVVAGAWSGEMHGLGFTEAFPEILKRLANSGNSVLVLGQVPTFELPNGFQNSLRKYLVASARSSKEFVACAKPEVQIANNKIQEIVNNTNLKNVKFIDTSESLLNKDGSIQFMHGEKFLYYDDNHINDNGSRAVFDFYLREYIATASKEIKY